MATNNEIKETKAIQPEAKAGRTPSQTLCKADYFKTDRDQVGIGTSDHDSKRSQCDKLLLYPNERDCQGDGQSPEGRESDSFEQYIFQFSDESECEYSESEDSSDGGSGSDV